MPAGSTAAEAPKLVPARNTSAGYWPTVIVTYLKVRHCNRLKPFRTKTAGESFLTLTKRSTIIAEQQRPDTLTRKRDWIIWVREIDG
jgi:hypothetical protein